MNLTQPNMSLRFVGEANFESQVLQSKGAVLVAFWAPWSKPCHVIDPVLLEVAQNCAGKVEVVKVNADDNPTLSLWFGWSKTFRRSCISRREICAVSWSARSARTPFYTFYLETAKLGAGMSLRRMEELDEEPEVAIERKPQPARWTKASAKSCLNAPTLNGRGARYAHSSTRGV
jgi:thioredoxin 1